MFASVPTASAWSAAAMTSCSECGRHSPSRIDIDLSQPPAQRPGDPIQQTLPAGQTQVLLQRDAMAVRDLVAHDLAQHTGQLARVDYRQELQVGPQAARVQVR